MRDVKFDEGLIRSHSAAGILAAGEVLLRLTPLGYHVCSCTPAASIRFRSDDDDRAS